MIVDMPETITLTFGERLLIARRRAGLTALEMAKRLRVAPNTVGSWEADRTTPKYLELIAWAEACDIDPELIDPDIRNRCSDHAAGWDVA